MLTSQTTGLTLQKENCFVLMSGVCYKAGLDHAKTVGPLTMQKAVILQKEGT